MARSLRLVFIACDEAGAAQSHLHLTEPLPTAAAYEGLHAAARSLQKLKQGQRSPLLAASVYQAGAAGELRAWTVEQPSSCV
jgi:hypothetical protein